MTQYSPAWLHGSIKEIFPNVFFVMGTNKTNYKGFDLQHSRNMVIIRNANTLSLINTVRLEDKGLEALDALGEVKNVIRIGAFHGRDDAFYLDRYKAKLWALPGMQHANEKTTDVELISGGEMPFPGCSLFIFETSAHSEGILHVNQEGGILITCDSIKNWLSADEFFSKETAHMYEQQGFFGVANVSNVWKQACKVDVADFMRLKALTFRHLISAHGEPLLNNAHEQLEKIINEF